MARGWRMRREDKLFKRVRWRGSRRKWGGRRGVGVRGRIGWRVGGGREECRALIWRCRRRRVWSR